MYTKLLFLILSLFVLIPSFAQKKKTKETDIKEPIIIEEIKAIEPIKEYISPRYIPPVPVKNIFFQLTNQERMENAYIFLYCPEMESPDYPYDEYLGSANNLIGSIQDKKGYAQIPEREFENSEFLIKASGYELLRVEANNLVEDTIINIALKPIISEQVIVLDEKGFYAMYKLEPSKYFYGECRPIYFKDGGHADPECAFKCLGCDIYLDRESQMKEILTKLPKQTKKLYNKVKKTGTYSFVVTKNDNESKRFSVMEENPQKKEFNEFRKELENTHWHMSPSKWSKKIVRLIFRAR